MKHQNNNISKISFERTLFFLILCVLIVLKIGIGHAQDNSFIINEGLNGSWYNPTTSGQGILIEVNEQRNVMFVAWFTFDPQQTESSQQQWYTASGDYSDDQAQLILYQSTGGGFDSTTPVETVIVGTLDFQFDSCSQSTMSYTFEDSFTESIDLKRLTPDILCQQFQTQGVTESKQQKLSSEPINVGISGAWYEPDTAGQGLLIDVIPGSNQLFAGWFTYATDQSLGQRWLTLQGDFTDTSATVEIFETTGGLFNQDNLVTSQKVGDATIDFVDCQIAILSYTFFDGVTGSIDLQQLIHSDLCEILQTKTVETPDELDKSTPVAFYDVSLVPMTDEIILPHQTVIVRDGVITDVAHYTQLLIPDDVVILDGRDKFLGPGLTEMHIHIARGDLIPARNAGTLLIANGITTALSMGDILPDITDVPQLGKDFAKGLYIGPNLLTSNIAFGRNPNNGGNMPPVTTRAQATEFAEYLKNMGYDYVKEYWYLNPAVLNQFEIESERLDLPIIGHIPRTRPMAESLSKGHKMSAHIQEPYVTFMNDREDPSLIAPAAQIFLDNQTYMTPTLAVFESFIKGYGGNLVEYNKLRAREGNQYTSPVVKGQWAGFYNSTQGAGQNIGGLDSLYEFFRLMTFEFYQAGVPLLIGTDAPGFPGVMSGFGAHVEMKLFRDVGIPTYEIYKAATKNAGDFVDETLNPEVGFGTVEVGKRADLILMDNNPLESIDHLERPKVVMAAGRMWSQQYLQTQLDVIADSYSRQQNKSISNIDTVISHCVEHLMELAIDFEKPR